MNIAELQRIENIIAEAETKKARSEGIVSKIIQEWQDEFEVDTLEKALALKETMEKAKKANDEKINTLFEQLEGSANWDELEDI
jgi:hypothetical protein